MSMPARVWRRLTEPPETITDPERRRQAQLLAGLVVVLIPLGLAAGVAELLLFAEFWPTFAALGVAVVLLSLAYVAARAGRERVGALTAVGVSTAMGFAVVVLNPGDVFSYAFLYVSVSLAALLFSTAGLWAVTGINLLGAVLLPPALGVPPPGNDPVAVPIFLVIAAALLFLGIRHRDAVERERRAALAASETRLSEAQRIAQIGSWELDLVHNRLTWSDEIYRIFEFERADFGASYQAFLAAVHPEDREAVNRAYNASVRDRTRYEIIHRLLMPDGRIKHVHERGETLYDRDGRPLHSLGTVQDVTERQEREAALRENQRQLETLMGNLPGMVYRCRNDRHWTMEFASVGARPLTGYAPEDFISGRVTYNALIHPDDREPVWQQVQAALAGRRPYHLVYRIQGADGSLKWVWEQGLGVCSPDGTLQSLEGFITDITERKHAEQALRESEERFRALAEAAPDGIFIVDNGRILDTNARGAELLGLGADAVIGREVSDFVPPEDWPAVREGMRSGDERSFELTIRRADGGLIPVEVRPRNSAYRGRPVRISTLRDLRAQRAAEAALRESESNFRTLTENANFGILVNHRGRHVYANPQLLAMLGYTAEEIRQTGIREVVHPDEYEKVMQRFGDRQAGKPVSSVYETVFVARDGQPVPVELTAALTHWEGEPAGLVFLQDIRERKRAEAALRESEERFRTLSEVSFEGIFIHDQGRIVDCNPTFAAMLGYTADEVRQRTVFDVVAPAQHDIIRRAMRDGYETPLELTAVRQDGSTFTAEVFGKPLEYQGRRLRVASVRDISARLRSEADMRKLSSAVEQAADSVLITNRQGVIEYVNPAFEHTTGYSRSEAIGQTPRLLKSGKQGPAFYDRLWSALLAGEVFSDVLINRRKDGGFYYEEKTITPLKDADGRVTHFISTGKDVTERMQTQERLQYMAQHDALTELPNRLLLLDRLKQSLARARWHQRLVAVLFIDLDRFKTINDTLGHEIGDRLLQHLAERFKRSVREGDTVARFGGDEFVIMLDDVASDKDVGMVAQKILDALAAPFTVDGQSLYMTASIGISLFPADGEDSGMLLKNADIAMYRSKELGKNTYQFYSADMSARAFERLSLETSLRRALERNEFVLHYQPQIDVDSGAIIGVEALIRWQHPDFGLVPPAEFIPLLEETGLIVPTGEWLLGEACRQLAVWHAAGWRKLRLAVNLSPRQVQAVGLVAAVGQAVDGLRGDPGWLELEITEGLLVQHAPEVIEKLEAVRALGVRLAIDDFGTGYSSLSYLRRFPIDTLKIDRSFVQDIPHDPDDSAITTAIIAMAQSLRLEAIAEGVENAAQRDFLRSRGCLLMQGFLFSKPLPADEMTRLLGNGVVSP